MFKLQHSPHFSIVFLSTLVCCFNYFKVIRALIAGRCFSGGQVPGGASPVTQCLPPALLPLPHRLSAARARLSLCHTSTQLNHYRCRPSGLQDFCLLLSSFAATQDTLWAQSGAPTEPTYKRTEKLIKNFYWKNIVHNQEALSRVKLSFSLVKHSVPASVHCKVKVHPITGHEDPEVK